MASKCHRKSIINKEYKCTIIPEGELFCGVCRKQYCESHFISNKELSFYLTGQGDRGVCYTCLLKIFIDEEGSSLFLRLIKKVKETLEIVFTKKDEFNRGAIIDFIGNHEFRDLLKANIRIIAGKTDVKTESLYNSVLYDYAPLVAFCYNLRSEYNFSFLQLLSAL